MSTLNQGVPAVAWTVSARLIAKLLDFAGLVVLARLLTPADFGLVAIAMSVVWIVEAVFDVPVTTPLLQVPKLTDDLLDTAFAVGVLRGIAVGVLLLCLAWPISAFFARPELILVILVLATSPIMRALVSPRMVIFARLMQFRPDFLMEVVAKVLSTSAALAFAAFTKSYWALVVGTVAYSFLCLVLSYILAPGRLRWRLKHWPLFSGYIGWGMLTQFFAALSWQVDRLALGRFSDAKTLGNYAMASNLAALPFQAIVIPAAKPLNAMIQTCSVDKRVDVYLKSTGALFILVGPIFVVLVVQAEELVELLFGTKWQDAAPFLKGLAGAGLLGLLHAPFGALATAYQSHSAVSVRAGTELAVKVIILALLFPLIGASAAVYAVAGASLVSACVLVHAVRRITGCGIVMQLMALKRPIIALIGITLCGLWFNNSIHLQADARYSDLITFGITFTLLLAAIAVPFIWWRASGCPPGAERLISDCLLALLRRIKG